DRRVVLVVSEEVADVTANSESYRQLRRGRPGVLRINRRLECVEVNVAVVAENECAPEAARDVLLERARGIERPDSERALRDQVRNLHILVSRPDHEAVIAARNRQVVGELVGVCIELITLRELIGTGD